MHLHSLFIYNLYLLFIYLFYRYWTKLKTIVKLVGNVACLVRMSLFKVGFCINICYPGKCLILHTIFYNYYFVNLPMTWTDSQRYCREKHTDLVTIESAEDMSRLKRPGARTTWSWIGLTDDPKSWKGVMGNDVNSWRWSATGETSGTDYHSWYPTEPNNIGGNQKCVFVKRQGTWADQDCSVKLMRC
uniref:C-type lectin domain-containing protein n=1 Tax=Seriola lalandi dorsalis TaxID=1841481 RepID=A0A3B4XXG8_SERLL